MRNVCDALRGPRRRSPNNKVRYKKGAFSSSCSEQPTKDKSLECSVSIVAHGGVSAACLAVADLLRDGEKIFAGETKPGVNRVQDSTVVIRGGEITRSSCFLCFLAGFVCDVKCFTHVPSVAKRKKKAKEGSGMSTEIGNKISPAVQEHVVCVQEIPDSHSKRTKNWSIYLKSFQHLSPLFAFSRK